MKFWLNFIRRNPQQSLSCTNFLGGFGCSTRLFVTQIFCFVLHWSRWPVQNEFINFLHIYFVRIDFLATDFIQRRKLRDHMCEHSGSGLVFHLSIKRTKWDSIPPFVLMKTTEVLVNRPFASCKICQDPQSIPLNNSHSWYWPLKPSLRKLSTSSKVRSKWTERAKFRTNYAAFHVPKCFSTDFHHGAWKSCER